jgi:hypothetical protein
MIGSENEHELALDNVAGIRERTQLGHRRRAEGGNQGGGRRTEGRELKAACGEPGLCARSPPRPGSARRPLNCWGKMGCVGVCS